MIRNIAVFCGSSSGYDKVFSNETIKLGNLLAQNKIKLIYGGTNVGLMGQIANTVLKNNIEVIGVIPYFIKDFGLVNNNLSELIIVKTMFERKEIMKNLADAFIALPGGYGTMEELFEVLSMSQLDLHSKPIALFNINGYYDDLIIMLQKMKNNGFLKAINLDLLIISDNAEELINKINNYKPIKTRKW